MFQEAQQKSLLLQGSAYAANKVAKTPYEMLVPSSGGHELCVTKDVLTS